MTKWEYKVLDPSKLERSFLSGTVKVDALEAKLNRLGEEGWELVSGHSSPGSKGLFAFSSSLYTFKRAKAAS